MSGTYDPDLNLILGASGIESPMYGGGRPGDNLYNCSIVAIDPDTGTLSWHFQAPPHVPNWEAVEDPVLADAEFDGKPRKLLRQASRNGYFFVLDRTTCEALLSMPFSFLPKSNTSADTYTTTEPKTPTSLPVNVTGRHASNVSTGGIRPHFPVRSKYHNCTANPVQANSGDSQTRLLSGVNWSIPIKRFAARSL